MEDNVYVNNIVGSSTGSGRAEDSSAEKSSAATGKAERRNIVNRGEEDSRAEDRLRNVTSLYPEELEKELMAEGYPKFRAKQLFQWIHARQTEEPSQMTNLPKNLRERLTPFFPVVREVTCQTSKKDGTRKYLFAMQDGEMIESVWMPYEHGNSVCISSQAGCGMGCTFCASAIGGFHRNLTAGEMAGQVYGILRDTGKRVDNIVVMGTGEPMQNYDQLIRFIRLISHEEGYGLSVRSITVSTCGIVPRIRQFAGEGLPVTLALSLHAVTDEERRRTMPVARTYGIEETLDACSCYFEQTGRRVTVEYALIRDENDTERHANALSALLRDRGFHVNLIPVNPVMERGMRPGTRNSQENFKKILEKNHINVTIRRGMGSDIDAACGQLRRKFAGSEKE